VGCPTSRHTAKARAEAGLSGRSSALYKRVASVAPGGAAWVPIQALYRPRIVALVGELVAVGMAKHVGLRLDAEIGCSTAPKLFSHGAASASRTVVEPPDPTQIKGLHCVRCFNLAPFAVTVEGRLEIYRARSGIPQREPKIAPTEFLKRSEASNSFSAGRLP
jgi:hypothetical protein